MFPEVDYDKLFHQSSYLILITTTDNDLFSEAPWTLSYIPTSSDDHPSMTALCVAWFTRHYVRTVSASSIFHALFRKKFYFIGITKYQFRAFLSIFYLNQPRVFSNFKTHFIIMMDDIICHWYQRSNISQFHFCQWKY